MFLTPKEVDIEKVKCKAYCEGCTSVFPTSGQIFKNNELNAFYSIRQELNELFDLFKGLPIIVSGSYVVKKILEFYHNKPILWDNNDIDIFCYDATALPEIIERIQNKNYTAVSLVSSKFETPFGVIDLIFNKTFTCPEEILNSFDFAYCAIGITETSAYFIANCMFDLMNKVGSRPNINLHRISSAYNVLKRMEKYIKRGFSLPDGFENILFSVFDKYKSVYGHNYWDKPNGSTIKSNYDNKQYIQVHERKIYRHDFVPELFSARKNNIIKTEAGEYDFLDVD